MNFLPGDDEECMKGHGTEYGRKKEEAVAARLCNRASRRAPERQTEIAQSRTLFSRQTGWNYGGLSFRVTSRYRRARALGCIDIYGLAGCWIPGKFGSVLANHRSFDSVWRKERAKLRSG